MFLVLVFLNKLYFQRKRRWSSSKVIRTVDKRGIWRWKFVQENLRSCAVYKMIKKKKKEKKGREKEYEKVAKSLVHIGS